MSENIWKNQFTWLRVDSVDDGRDVCCCLTGLGTTRVAISNDFPGLLFIDDWFEDLISFIFIFCCWETFGVLVVGDELGFNIFGGGGGVGDGWMIWGSCFIRSAVKGIGVTRVA